MSKRLKIGLISLGCAKNLVDSEVMLGALRRDGMILTEDARQADVVIVNTCGFIEASKQESINTILQAHALRETGRCQALIVAGCLTQRYPKELQKELPEVDAFVGLNEVPRIGEIVREVVEGGSGVPAATGSVNRGGDAAPTNPLPPLFWSGPARYIPDYATPRYRLTPRHSAYVKIAEGCNHPCTFCSIPRIRGRHRSRPLDDVLAEVRALVEQGTREINLISQDTTFYGRDRGGDAAPTAALVGPASPPRSGLCELLRAVQELPGDFWVRLLYTHPAHWSDDLIETMAACDKVCRYVDLPLQHIADDVLARMRRETDGAYIRDLLKRIRTGIPGIALRTTFIVGFPGETEEQFAELLAFIAQTKFERLGIFTYSQEDHTPAGNLAGQLPARVKKQRYRQAMALQQKVSRQLQRRWVGQTLRVLVEKDGIGRTHADAPDIDGHVVLSGKATLGEFADVRITAAREYDLVGKVVE